MMSDKVNVRAMLKGINQLPSNERQKARDLLEKLEIIKITPDDTLTGTKIRSFCLEERKYDADSHIDVLRKIIKIAFLRYPKEINKILSIASSRNKYFSKNPNDLRLPELVRGTDIYFETNENAKSICVRCKKIIKLFNMDYTSFGIDYYK